MRVLKTVRKDKMFDSWCGESLDVYAASQTWSFDFGEVSYVIDSDDVIAMLRAAWLAGQRGEPFEVSESEEVV